MKKSKTKKQKLYQQTVSEKGGKNKNKIGEWMGGWMETKVSLRDKTQNKTISLTSLGHIHQMTNLGRNLLPKL